MINKELLQEALDLLKANPNHWDQKIWHCGTSHCYAGFVELVVYGLPGSAHYQEVVQKREGKDIGVSTRTRATQALGLSDFSAGDLFYKDNTLEMLESKVQRLIERAEEEERLAANGQ